MNKKRIRKFIPAPWLYIDQFEKWINDLAAQGLYIIKTNWLFATLKKTEPYEGTIRLNIYHETESPLDNGKNKRNNKSKLKVSYTSYDSPSAVPARKESERSILVNDCNRSIGSLTFMIFLLLSLFITSISPYFESRVYSDMLNVFTQLSGAAFAAVSVALCVRKAMEYLKLKRYYKGKPNMDTPYRQHFVRDRIIIFCILILLFVLSAETSKAANYEIFSNEAYAKNEPILITYELLNNQPIEDDEYSTANYSVYYQESKSLILLPFGYDIEYTSSSNMKELSHISYVRLRYKGLIDRCYLSFVKNNYAEDLVITYNDYFEKIAYFYKEGVTYLFMMNDKEGIYIAYSGESTAEYIIDKITQMK
ncbi:MAG: hypothetical protein JXN65_10050 [Clostridia bacterium]|nr:hypothetical protein [Clostridia bacterium]